MFSKKSDGRSKLDWSGVRSGVAPCVNATVLSPGRSIGRDLSDQITFSSLRVSRATCRQILSRKANLLIEFARFNPTLNVCTIGDARC